MVNVPKLSDQQMDTLALAAGSGVAGYVAYEFSEDQPEIVGIATALGVGYLLSR